MSEPSEKDTGGGGAGPEKWPGEKEGKWRVPPPVEGSHAQNTPSHERKVGVGNRKVTDDDRAKAKQPKSKSEVGTKPLYSETYFDNTREPGHGNKEGDDDKSYYSTLTAKASAEALAASFDVEKQKAKLTLGKVKVEGAVAHGQFDVGGWLHDVIFGPSPGPSAPNPSSPLSPMAARMGDMSTHGTPLAPGSGSPNVLIGGLPAWRVGPDMHACPGTGTSHGAGPVTPGAPTVLINGFPAARAGDFVTEPSGGPNVIALGCVTVFIGMAAPVAPPPPPPPDPKPEDLPWVLFEAVATGDAVAGEASVKGEAEADLKNHKGKVEGVVGAEVAAMKAELPLKLRIRIPNTMKGGTVQARTGFLDRAGTTFVLTLIGPRPGDDTLIALRAQRAFEIARSSLVTPEVAGR
jgi:uncharacterized Zn-binding protein involved in type VI secretion